MTPCILPFSTFDALSASGYSFAGTSRMEGKTIPDSPVTENEPFFVARYIEQDGTIWRVRGSEKQLLPARKAVIDSGSGI